MLIPYIMWSRSHSRKFPFREAGLPSPNSEELVHIQDSSQSSSEFEEEHDYESDFEMDNHYELNQGWSDPSSQAADPIQVPDSFDAPNQLTPQKDTTPSINRTLSDNSHPSTCSEGVTPLAPAKNSIEDKPSLAEVTKAIVVVLDH